VLYRYWRGPDIREVRPMTVVEDGPDWLVLWLAPGTPVVWSPLTDGREVREAALAERFLLPRMLTERTWRGTGILKLVPPAAAYSVWLFWNDDGSFRGWYGNLEDVHHRWVDGSLGILDTSDHVLDVWCPPGGPPVWKDEDEFAVVTGLPGWWTEQEGTAIRTQGAALMAAARRGDPPFDHAWTDFRPDPDWPVPRLPADWSASAP